MPIHEMVRRRSTLAIGPSLCSPITAGSTTRALMSAVRAIVMRRSFAVMNPKAIPSGVARSLRMIVTRIYNHLLLKLNWKRNKSSAKLAHLRLYKLL